MNDFDRIAGGYDFLARTVFGKSITDCQTHFLSEIPDSCDILILGGGTGWIIEELKDRTKDLRICYVELSGQMISKAKSQPASSHVVFIHGSEKDIPKDRMFDVVITNFFLDLFSDDELKTKIQLIHPFLKDNGIWLVSDFVNQKWWHRIILWIMYRFFKLTAKIEASTLPRWESVLNAYGFIELKSHFYYGAFIKSVVYKRDYF